MKRSLLTLLVIAFAFIAKAQTTGLVPDQNPNYKISQDKYTGEQVALQTTNNTTLQNTYKAYDWTTAKAERRAERRASNYYYSGYNYNGYNRYNNRYYSNGNYRGNYYTPRYNINVGPRYNYGPYRYNNHRRRHR